MKDCRKRPDLFNELILKRAPYWSRQIDLCRSVVEYRTTVAYSGNMVGKDYWIAGIVLWWLLTRPKSLCIITGPERPKQTAPQRTDLTPTCCHDLSMLRSGTD